MPARNLHVIGACPTGSSVVAASEEVVVMRLHPQRNQHAIVPLSAFPCNDLKEAASFLFKRPYAMIFFIDEHTLCLFPGKYTYTQAPTLTRILSEDLDFRTASVERQEISALKCGNLPCVKLQQMLWDACSWSGYRIVHKRISESCLRPDSGVELAVWLDPGELRRGGAKPLRTTLTITSTDVARGELFPYTCNAELDAFALNPNEPGAFFCVAGSTETSLYVDIDPIPMHWCKYPGSAYNLYDHRWLMTRTDNTISIFDAKERSLIPAIKLEAKETDKEWPTMAISKQGRGIIINQGSIYEFTSSATAFSLEACAAFATWKQLSPEQRDAMNAQGPVLH